MPMMSKPSALGKMIVGGVALVGALFCVRMFLFARADWKMRDCARWPESGHCHEALSSQYLFGMMATAIIAVALGYFWVARHA